MPAMKRRKACEACRQQKVRCDAEPPKTCSRCRRMRLCCTFASNPGARRTKAQLHRDVEQLRGQAENGTISMSSNLFPVNNSVPAEEQPQINPPVPLSFFTASPLATHDSLSASEDNNCSAQVFEGQQVEASKIHDCFQLFFRDYLPSLPLIDPSLSPNEYHKLSDFLFWVIVFVGSRRYSQDPTLLDRLRPHMNAMALLALQSRDGPFETIKGLLLLCFWPIPMNTIHKDISVILSGAAFHLAMQTGLHLSGSGQDFARTKLDHSRASSVDRTRLWIYCLFVYHSTNVREGLGPVVLADPKAISLEDSSFDMQLSVETRNRRKMYSILVCSCTTIMRASPSAADHAPMSTLTPLIALYDSRLLNIAADVTSQTDAITLSCCRIHVLSLLFLERCPTSRYEQCLVELYAVACGLVEDITSQNQTTQVVEACTMFVERAVMLAAFCILKIHRSELAPFIDLNAGERAFFGSLRFFRRVSVENDDLGARSVSILSQLWTSQKVFKRRSGQVESLGTRIRSRQSMSIVFDCFWWWREEFAGQVSPYGDSSHQEGSEQTSTPETMQPNTHNISAPLCVSTLGDEILTLSEETFPDYNWAANLNFRDFELGNLGPVIETNL